MKPLQKLRIHAEVLIFGWEKALQRCIDRVLAKNITSFNMQFMPQHVKKLANGSIAPCNCATCRTALPGEEALNPMQELPTAGRAYIYVAIAFIAFCVLGTYIYVYTR